MWAAQRGANILVCLKRSPLDPTFPSSFPCANAGQDRSPIAPLSSTLHSKSLRRRFASCAAFFRSLYRFVDGAAPSFWHTLARGGTLDANPGEVGRISSTMRKARPASRQVQHRFLSVFPVGEAFSPGHAFLAAVSVPGSTCFTPKALHSSAQGRAAHPGCDCGHQRSTPKMT